MNEAWYKVAAVLGGGIMSVVDFSSIFFEYLVVVDLISVFVMVLVLLLVVLLLLLVLVPPWCNILQFFIK